jgi:putative SOS response-associated peptidase YedK
MAKRRCLIPADFFYEWQVVPGRRAKQPYAVAQVSGEPFALGGLWDFWRPRSSQAPADGVVTCTILTTEPNGLLAPIHDRMPVIVCDEAFDDWLDPRTPRATVDRLTRPVASEALRAWRVGLRVNAAAEDDIGLIDELSA